MVGGVGAWRWWVVPHLRGERGSVSCHSSISLDGGCHSSAEIIEDSKDFIQFEGLYSLFSVFERFLEFFWFDRFFYLNLRVGIHFPYEFL